MAYYEQNRRELELTKHISLAQLDPESLLLLRQNGECFVDIPEEVYNMDYPSHYFRRIKAVSISIPCIAGPNTTIACTLTMLSNSLRKDATLIGTNPGLYDRQSPDDIRFRDEITSIQSIATSRAQNDAGLFELNFRDERYLPFEGAGAISKWHIKLNKDFRQFDYNTITDVMLQIAYTARDGGGVLQSGAVASFQDKLNAMALSANKTGLYRVFDLKREFQDKWHKFLFPANPADEQELVLDNLTDRLPYFTRSFAVKETIKIEVVVKSKHNSDPFKILLTTSSGTTELNLGINAPATSRYKECRDVLLQSVALDMNEQWIIKMKQDILNNDYKSLPAEEIEEMFLVVKYKIE